MPRLPVDGKKVIEHRITFGTKERDLLDEISMSYRIQAITGEDSVVEVFSDFGKVLAVAGTIGGLLELLGVTDQFDFDDDVKALVLPTKAKLQALRDRAPPTGPLGDLLKELLSPFQG